MAGEIKNFKVGDKVRFYHYDADEWITLPGEIIRIWAKYEHYTVSYNEGRTSRIVRAADLIAEISYSIGNTVRIVNSSITLTRSEFVGEIGAIQSVQHDAYGNPLYCIVMPDSLPYLFYYEELELIPELMVDSLIPLKEWLAGVV